MKTKPECNVRWLFRRDMPEVLKIERASFELLAWTEEDFLCCLRQRNCIGMVADSGRDVAGFVVYQRLQKEIRVLNIAVHPEHRGKKVGVAMVDRLKSKLTQQLLSRIILDVRETNISTQLFFKSQGFQAISILRGYYEDTAEDAYHMRYCMKREDDPYSPFHPTNRITRTDA